MERLPDLTQRYIAQDKARAFAQWAKALASADGIVDDAVHVFASRWPQSKHLEVIQRAAVSAGSTTGWGAQLTPLESLSSAFLDFIRPRTVLGRLQGVRKAPFNISFAVQSGGFGAAWTGEGVPIIVSKGTFERVELGRSKIAGITVFTEELARSSDPSAEDVFTRDLSNAVIEFTDTQLLDPTVAGNDESPASITNGATAVTTTGESAAQVEADLSEMVTALATAGVVFEAPYWVMKPTTALFLAKLRGAGGERIFPDVGPLGGSIWTIPVITSASAGDQITLLDAAEIMVAEDGIEVTASTQGALQMSDTPDSTPTGTVLVSLWQTHCIALKAVRTIRWVRRRAGSVAWMAVAY